VWRSFREKEGAGGWRDLRGRPIARTISAHSAQMRVKRRLEIRTEAARASLKILIPTVGCVFPTLWLILLGPALIVVLSINHH